VWISHYLFREECQERGGKTISHCNSKFKRFDEQGNMANATNRGNRSRSSIKILLLGDGGVGKSSIISTFVSRHFSSAVPGKMTKVRLPPDPTIGGFIITTIMDSQDGDVALISAAEAIDSTCDADAVSEMGSTGTSTDSGVGGGYLMDSVERSVNFGGGIDHVDSIILVYDLGRIETFDRLESHWLPLIERCYNSKLPVIIAGNKLDLLHHTSNELNRSHRQVIALLQRFKFVRQCIKCSAQNLRNVDEIFLKARQSVLYPITPALYDLEKCCLANNCKRSITRIFRMYDVDNDGLLSSIELNAFQKYAFNVQLKEGDFKGWQKLISRHEGREVEAVVRDGKFTVAGFMAIFDIFICQNRLDVPWKILRQFGYDDDLKLHIPRSLYKPQNLQHTDKDILRNNDWSLSASARTFLTAIFHQFNSAEDGTLSKDDILKIFWVIPGASLPPWHPKRAKELFKRSFSLPVSFKNRVSDVASDVNPSILNSEESVENRKLNSPIEPLAFSDWMGHWHMISAVSPSLTRAEMYRLGHIENPSTIGLFRHDNSSASTQSRQRTIGSNLSSSTETRLWVIGKRGSGKTTLINYLQSTNDDTISEDLSPERGILTLPESLSKKAATSFTCVRTKSFAASSKGGIEENETMDHISYLIFTEIPAIDLCNLEQKDRDMSELRSQMFGTHCSNRTSCDLVMFVFDPSDTSSLSYVKEIENVVLDDNMPRVFVASANYDGSTSLQNAGLEMSHRYCESIDLEPPISLKEWTRSKVLDYLCHIIRGGPIRVIPYGERKRREAQKQSVIRWFGGLLTTSLVIAIGVGIFINRSKTDARKELQVSWWRNFLPVGRRKYVH